ncbi:hypothetical protein BS78_05G146600 [Paspalum vaginatum]|nr:hypothetical protein BS78_05G146600 [Paspalum vaginatum]KAJ1275584.1 hypothetical protein BS78_05G146600 [Paspalum vaginatum]KAJ1275585.1 hypothetical protein BS78_05G146600 [Paspalum vaginatum]
MTIILAIFALQKAFLKTMNGIGKKTKIRNDPTQAVAAILLPGTSGGEPPPGTKATAAGLLSPPADPVAAPLHCQETAFLPPRRRRWRRPPSTLAAAAGDGAPLPGGSGDHALSFLSRVTSDGDGDSAQHIMDGIPDGSIWHACTAAASLPRGCTPPRLRRRHPLSGDSAPSHLWLPDVGDGWIRHGLCRGPRLSKSSSSQSSVAMPRPVQAQQIWSGKKLPSTTSIRQHGWCAGDADQFGGRC